jgi:hypothetical protein
MILIHLLVSSNIYGQAFGKKLLKGSNLTIAQGIKRQNIDMLRPFIGSPVRLQHVFNVYRDHQAVFDKRFSKAQEERNWHVAVQSGYLTRTTSNAAAHRMLGEFSGDISGIDEPDNGWYPSTFGPHGRSGLVSKIASGAFYIFEYKPGTKGRPMLSRLWDLDHAKSWDRDWHNKDGD